MMRTAIVERPPPQAAAPAAVERVELTKQRDVAELLREIRRNLAKILRLLTGGAP
jgi:hypothetical protein